MLMVKYQLLTFTNYWGRPIYQVEIKIVLMRQSTDRLPETGDGCRLATFTLDVVTG